jgi:AcrR family transcriptional regulator
MTVQRVRNQRHAPTIDRLLNALETELETQGYRDVTMRTVARRAGVSPATAYTYFGSLEHMVTELFCRMVLGLEPGKVDRRHNAARRAGCVLAEIALLVDGRPQLAEAVTAALFSTDPDVAGVRERIGREFVERIDAALAEDSTPARVETLNLILIGALVRAGTGHGTYANVASRLERAAALVMGGKSA